MRTSTPALNNLLASSKEFYIAELYTFTLLGGLDHTDNVETLRYSSLDIPITRGSPSYTWTAGELLLKRSNLKLQRGIEVDELTIEMMPVTALIGGLSFIPEVRNGALDGARLKLERVFYPSWGVAETGTFTLFSGRVSDVEIGRTKITIKVKSELELLNVKWPRNLYMPSCGWAPYDEGCGIDKSTFIVAAEVDAGSTVSVVKSTLQTNVIPVPENPNWTELRPKGDVDCNWGRADLSNDGNIIFAGEKRGVYLYRSKDGGSGWAEICTVPDNAVIWIVACSNDGETVLASGGLSEVGGGYTWISVDGGDNWTLKSEPGYFLYYRAVCSGDGSAAMMGTAYFVPLYQHKGKKTNNTWANYQELFDNCATLAIDSDGSVMLCGQGNWPESGGNAVGKIFISIDSGTNFYDKTPPGGTKDWGCAAMNSDGSIIVAAAYSGRVYKTTDYGDNWTEIYPTGDAEDKNWVSASMDESGTNLFITCGDALYYSLDGGSSWSELKPDEGTHTWNDIKVNRSGTYAIACSNTRLWKIEAPFGAWLLEYPDNFFDGGVIIFTSGQNIGIQRTIKSFVGLNGKITLIQPLPHTPAEEDTFNVYPGCDKQIATCGGVFRNLANFRGFPFIPNPESAT